MWCELRVSQWLWVVLTAWESSWCFGLVLNEMPLINRFRNNPWKRLLSWKKCTVVCLNEGNNWWEGGTAGILDVRQGDMNLLQKRQVWTRISQSISAPAKMLKQSLGTSAQRGNAGKLCQTWGKLSLSLWGRKSPTKPKVLPQVCSRVHRVCGHFPLDRDLRNMPISELSETAFPAVLRWLLELPWIQSTEYVRVNFFSAVA